MNRIANPDGNVTIVFKGGAAVRLSLLGVEVERDSSGAVTGFLWENDGDTLHYIDSSEIAAVIEHEGHE